jgi:tetratricopeptide (TPR) repeat protein
MNYLLLSLLLWIWDNRSSDAISNSNRSKVEAQRAYQQGNYKKAAIHYQKILNASLFTEPEVRLNLANSLFLAKNLTAAQRHYKRLSLLNDTSIVSKAFMQLGLIGVQNKDTIAALSYLKKSLKTNPYNSLARFNFELLQNRFSGKTPIKKDKPQAEKQQNDVTQSLEPSLQPVETEQKKDLLKRLNTLNMTEAQATMILDAMKASEIQYLQQRQQKIDNQDKGKW